jgi:hypothetical protein
MGSRTSSYGSQAPEANIGGRNAKGRGCRSLGPADLLPPREEGVADQPNDPAQEASDAQMAAARTTSLIGRLSQDCPLTG